MMTPPVRRASTCWDLLAVYGVLLCSCSCWGLIEVTVPEAHLVAVRGLPTILGCKFHPELGSDLKGLVITWQRQEDSRVVHSYYYEQDQLETQSAEYRNRTSLFQSELGKGNASLRIKNVVPSDVGRYQCMVSTSSGTSRAELQLEYGAFFTEPRLSISFSATDVSLQYEAEGFPKPEVWWLGDEGQNLSHHTELLQGGNQDPGLYYLKSSYVAQTPALNITFVLKNKLLHQDLQRPVSFSYADHSSNGVVIMLILICVLLLITVFILAWLYYHKKK